MEGKIRIFVSIITLLATNLGAVQTDDDAAAAASPVMIRKIKVERRKLSEVPLLHSEVEFLSERNTFITAFQRF